MKNVVKQVLSVFVGLCACTQPGVQQPKSNSLKSHKGMYGTFSICKLTKNSESVVQGTLLSRGANGSLAMRDGGSAVEEARMTIDVVRTVGGVARSGAVSVWMPGHIDTNDNSSQGPLGATRSAPGYFFLHRVADGDLGVHPCGGFFWPTDAGYYVNRASTRGGAISNVSLEREVIAALGGAVCDDDINTNLSAVVPVIASPDGGLDGGSP